MGIPAQAATQVGTQHGVSLAAPTRRHAEVVVGLQASSWKRKRTDVEESPDTDGWCCVAQFKAAKQKT
jgi:hypothetical protein